MKTRETTREACIHANPSGSEGSIYYKPHSIVREVSMSFEKWCHMSVSAVLAVIVSGCVGERNVTMNTNPTGASVAISSDSGLKDFPIGETPLAYNFKFGSTSSGPLVYKATFSAKGYEPNTVRIERDNHEQTSIFVELRPEMVREVPRLETKITPEKGYTVEPRPARAWVEDIEREGMPASNIVRLGDRQTVLGMSLSPDGNDLVFSLGEIVKDENGNEKTTANLRAVPTKGGGIAEITSGQWLDNFPALGPDGSLHFCSDRLRPKRIDIFRISSQGTIAIAVVRQTSEGFNSEPSVAKKGIIAFTYRPDYRGQVPTFDQIWTLGGDNQYPTQLREGKMPAMSPDGTQIAYIGPDKQLWKMPINGQNPVQLMNTVSPDGKKHPSWSPDGQYILYASDEAKDSKGVPNYDIWMIREDGTNLRQLTTNGSVDDFPIVSPNRKYIYFVSNRGFKEGIWRIPFPESN